MADALLDTTFFIDLRRGDRGAMQLWRAIADGSLSASFSAVTAFELWLGNQDEEEQTFYEAAFVVLEEAVLTALAARRAGTWLRPLRPERAERLIRDALVAACASEREEPVYTRNRRDFRVFPVELRGY